MAEHASHSRELLIECLNEVAQRFAWRRAGLHTRFSGPDHTVVVHFRKSTWGDLYYLEVMVFFEPGRSRVTQSGADAFFAAERLVGRDDKALVAALDFTEGSMSDEQRRDIIVRYICDELAPVIKPFGDREEFIRFLKERDLAGALGIKSRQELGLDPP